MATTSFRPHAPFVEDDSLFRLIPFGDSGMAWSLPSFHPSTRVLAPTPVATRSWHTAMFELIDVTGDAIDDALAQDSLAATEVPALDQATVEWLGLLITMGVAALSAAERGPAFTDLMRSGPNPATETTHTRLAHELRDLTGLSAKSLGTAVGVTREQYQRWLAGRPISDTRHGQLVYLHTMAADVARRLGDQARLWWKTPTESGRTPEELLTQRLGDTVHRLVTQIPDPHPTVNGVLVGLPAQMIDDDEGDGDGESSAAWSPYDASQR